MQHQNMVWQDIRRWSSRIRTWSMEASEELEIRRWSSIKSMHKISTRSTDSEGSACNIKTWSGKTSEDGQAESEHGLWKHQKNLRSEAEALKFSCYHAKKHFKVRRQRRCSATSCLTLMIFKRCLHKHQIRSKYKIAGYAD